MSFYKLIVNSVLRSGRVYGGYFLSAIFSVIVFFIFSMLNFHPQLASGLTASHDSILMIAKLVMGVSQVLIVFLSFVFLWYSFGIFAKARKRDLSIYVMLGIRPQQLRKLLFGENLLIGIGAILAGTTIGLVFMKVILIMMQNVLKLNSGLAFYMPIKAITVTAVVYMILFVLVSSLLVMKIETGNLTQLGKSEEIPEPLPKVNRFLVVLSVILLLFGYQQYYSFVHLPVSLFQLFLVVFSTVLGTFLFFKQALVYYYFAKRRSKRFWKKEQLLLTSEGMYRARENANFFALIACTAAVALVGISVTATLGGLDANKGNTLPATIILEKPQAANQTTANTLLKTVQSEIVDKIEKAGHQVTDIGVRAYRAEVLEDGKTEGVQGAVIRISDYNRIAKELGLKKLTVKPGQVLSPAPDVKMIDEKIPERTIQLFVGTNQTGASLEAKLVRVPVVFQFRYERIWIVADEWVQQYFAKNDTESVIQYQVINYPNWEKDEKLNEDILQYLTAYQDVYERKVKQFYAKNEGVTDITGNEEWQQMNQRYFIGFNSPYVIWKMSRQANGLILMIGMMIGGVFFVFSSSILYFRLFGELDKQGRYHRNLYRIGLTPKSRHKIVTRQLLSMYFVPLLMALLHATVAFWGVVTLLETNIWSFYLIIIGSYFGLQFVLFLFSRWRYLTHLDLRAENPNDY